MDKTFNRSGERFQNDAVSVSGFAGFVWTERDHNAPVLHPLHPPPPPTPKKKLSVVYLGATTVAAVTSGLLTIVKTGITIVSYFGNVAASLFALTIVKKFTPR